jgi:hypothetical protein
MHQHAPLVLPSRTLETQLAVSLIDTQQQQQQQQMKEKQ